MPPAASSSSLCRSLCPIICACNPETCFSAVNLRFIFSLTWDPQPPWAPGFLPDLAGPRWPSSEGWPPASDGATSHSHRIMHDEVSETENIRKNLAIERMIIEGCEILLDTSQTFVRQGTVSVPASWVLGGGVTQAPPSVTVEPRVTEHLSIEM